MSPSPGHAAGAPAPAPRELQPAPSPTVAPRLPGGGALAPALGPAGILALQRSGGNQAVTRLLGRAPLRVARTPETAFNPSSVVHDLRRAIDQADVTDGWGFDVASGRLGPTTRRVDAELVMRVLGGLAPKQIELVQSLYAAEESSTLDNDLFGPGQSHHPSNLKPDQQARIRALLRGTAPQEGHAADAALEAAAIELHELLGDELNESRRERVMALLRPAGATEAIDLHYHRLYSRDPSDDLTLRLKGPQRDRAFALRAGDPARADAFAIADKQRALAELQAKRSTGELTFPEMMGYEQKRQQLIDGITATVAAVRQDAVGDPANVGLDADQAARERLAVVMATPVGPTGARLADELAFTLQGTEAAGIVVADHSLVETAARRLLEMEARHTTDQRQVAELLRGLRAQAEHDAVAAIPHLPPAQVHALKAQPPGLAKAQLVAARAAGYVERFVTAYNLLRLPYGRSWEAIVASADAAGSEMLGALAAGGGALDPVEELHYAVRRRDAGAIRHALREHPDVAALEHAYDEKFKPEVLRQALFGIGGADAAMRPQSWLAPPPGAVRGREAEQVDELLDAPAAARRGPAAEVESIVAGGRREVGVTEDDSGAMGWLRERGDVPETQRLMHESVAQLQDLQRKWVEHPEQRAKILAEMRQVRATVSGDTSAYEQENEQMRAEVRSAVSFAVQVALVAALPGVGEGLAGFLATTALNVGASVASNLVIYGDAYDLGMFYRDVAGGGFGALGGKLGEDFVRLVAREISGDAAQVAVKVAGEAGVTPKLAEELAQATRDAEQARADIGALVEAGARETANIAGSTAASSVVTGTDGFTAEALLKAFLLNRVRRRPQGPAGEPAPAGEGAPADVPANDNTTPPPPPPRRPGGVSPANENAPEWLLRPAQNENDWAEERATGTDPVAGSRRRRPPEPPSPRRVEPPGPRDAEASGGGDRAARRALGAARAEATGTVDALGERAAAAARAAEALPGKRHLARRVADLTLELTRARGEIADAETPEAVGSQAGWHAQLADELGELEGEIQAETTRAAAEAAQAAAEAARAAADAAAAVPPVAEIPVPAPPLEPPIDRFQRLRTARQITGELDEMQQRLQSRKASDREGAEAELRELERRLAATGEPQVARGKAAGPDHLNREVKARTEDLKTQESFENAIRNMVKEANEQFVKARRDGEALLDLGTHVRIGDGTPLTHELVEQAVADVVEDREANVTNLTRIVVVTADGTVVYEHVLRN